MRSQRRVHQPPPRHRSDHFDACQIYHISVPDDSPRLNDRCIVGADEKTEAAADEPTPTRLSDKIAEGIWPNGIAVRVDAEPAQPGTGSCSGAWLCIRLPADGP